MNRGFLQSAAQMQQPLATPDAPSWWHPTPAPPPPQYNTCPFGGAPADTNYYPYHHRAPEVPPHESLSLLLMGVWPSAEDGGATGKGVASQVFHDQAETPVKQEGGGYAYGDGFDYANNMLDFSNSFRSGAHHLPPPPPPPRHHRSSSSSSECDGNKRARVQPPPSSPLKVRKEKLGDRITTLHQLVSPFGKTDTASVLMEAIQYIRFLQRQIEALSLPYLGTANSRRPHPSVGTEMTGMFPEDPGQLLNDHCNKRKKEGGEEEPERDLSGRGLCLVPVACTVQVGSDNGADYWAPAALAGGWPSDR